MAQEVRIKSALISVFEKTGLDDIAKKLDELGVSIYSTGGTQSFLEGLGIEVNAVEDLTGFPSVFGGRVKTLHPMVFGGILNRRQNEGDVQEKADHNIPDIDLVIVDLYPFEETLKNTDDESSIIEKIDIGGISLIRAAAKNFSDVWCVSSRDQYADCLAELQAGNGSISREVRQKYGAQAFAQSAHYDSAIYGYFNREAGLDDLRISSSNGRILRYGENPHQQGEYLGDLEAMFEKLHGKELSYNNLLDVDAAVCLMNEFLSDDPTIAVMKHNNACGMATRSELSEAWKDALAGDPVSAFGGILIANREIDKATAEGMHEIFFEVVIAPSYSAEALAVLQQKKNRIILKQLSTELPGKMIRTALNGYLVQDRDNKTETTDDLTTATEQSPSDSEIADLLFANKLVKHTKSNTIVLAKNGQLLASGTGQTSRVDALQQAIEKARRFEFDLKGAVMASDAFFPFPDCVEIAHEAGINSVIQPGGSIRDKESVDYCNANGMSMVITGVRHFKH
jgi:phosphoribosylaminoimidazolecarboxamide formyltransferase/IMP cyclohydrolase